MSSEKEPSITRIDPEKENESLKGKRKYTLKPRIIDFFSARLSGDGVKQFSSRLQDQLSKQFEQIKSDTLHKHNWYRKSLDRSMPVSWYLNERDPFMELFIKSDAYALEKQKPANDNKDNVEKDILSFSVGKCAFIKYKRILYTKIHYNYTSGWEETDLESSDDTAGAYIKGQKLIKSMLPAGEDKQDVHTP